MTVQLPCPQAQTTVAPWVAPAPQVLRQERPAAVSAPTLSHRLRTALRAWWTDLWADDRTRYLSRATCMADLERRIRHWENADRSPWLPLP
jgi:hypothetical protein